MIRIRLFFERTVRFINQRCEGNVAVQRRDEMRFAFVVSSGLGYQIPDLFLTEESFSEFRKALKCLSENNFDGVELNLHFGDKQKLARIKESIESSGLKLASVGTGLLYTRDKLSFTSRDAKERARAVSIVKQLVQFAGSKEASVIIGLVRGPVGMRDAASYFGNCLGECDSAARHFGTRIAVEAMNRYEASFLNTADEVSTFIEREKLTSTGILLDTFHMNIEEQSIDETVRKYHSKIVHFHIADSNRWPPGYGHLKVEDSLNLLKTLGYRGWVSAETLPKPSRVEAVEATSKFLGSLGFMRN